MNPKLGNAIAVEMNGIARRPKGPLTQRLEPIE
jgi:hypothetical protein